MVAVDLRRLDTPIAFEDSFEGRLGVAYEAVTPEEVSGHADVESVHLAPHGAVALGVFASLAEGAASLGTAVGVLGDGMSAAGLSNETTLTRDVPGGRVTFVARRRSRAPDLHVWDVECRDGSGTTCAVSKVLIAVRPPRERA